MADEAGWVCTSDALVEKGPGVRFVVHRLEGDVPAFVVRHAGRVRAYLNRCAHVSVELDWEHGQFFDPSRLYLICSTHGAMYEPQTGYCVAGPCKGRRLESLDVFEREGAIYLKDCGK